MHEIDSDLMSSRMHADEHRTRRTLREIITRGERERERHLKKKNGDAEPVMPIHSITPEGFMNSSVAMCMAVALPRSVETRLSRCRQVRCVQGETSEQSKRRDDDNDNVLDSDLG